MDGIDIVVILVRCTTNLLLCDIIPTEHLRFEDMEACRSEASRLVAARQSPLGSEVWMAKCRYQLASPDPRRLRGAQVDRSPSDVLARWLSR